MLYDVPGFRWDWHHYETGHMIYLNADVLQQLHDDVAAFVRATEVPK
jgi:hypothetical protein